MAENRTETTSAGKRTGRIHHVILAAVILLLVNGLVLSVFTLFEQTKKLESRVSNSMDRLYTSITAAENASEGLTSIFDNRYLERLEFLKHVADNEAEDYSTLMQFAARYLGADDLFVMDRRTGTYLYGTGEEPSKEAVSDLAVYLQKQETSRNVRVFEGNRYYMLFLTDRLTLVQCVSGEAYEYFMDNIYTPEEVIRTNLSEGNNFSFAVRGGTVLYSPNESENGMKLTDIMEIQQNLPAFVDGHEDRFSVAKYNGQILLMMNRHIDGVGLDLYHGTSLDYVFTNTERIVWPVLAGIAIITALYILYSYFLRDDYVNKRSLIGMTREILRYKSTAFVILSVIFIAGAAYYSRTTTGLADFIHNYPQALSNAENAYYDSIVCQRDLQEELDNASVQNAQMISAYLSDYPERRTEEELGQLSDIFRYDYIMMFDRTGTETLSDSRYTGYVISTDPNAQSYVFNPLKKGVPYVIRETAEDELTGQENRIVGVTTKNTDGQVDGFLQTVFRPVDLDYALAISTMANTFDNSVLSNTFENFAVDRESEELIYAPNHELIGEAARDAGFPEEALRSGFTGYLDMKEEQYFAASKQVETMYLYSALPVSLIFMGRDLFVVIAVILVFLSILCLTWLLGRMVIPHRRKEDVVLPPPVSQRGSDGMILVETEEGIFKETLAPHKRWSILPRNWLSMNAEEKLGIVVGNVLLVISLIFLVIVESRDQIYGEHNLISYILGMTWPKGFNIFSVSAALITGITIFVAAYIIRSLLLLLARLLDSRGETVCRLLRSCVKYVAAIAALYMTFSFFGMDVKSLAASVGFLALIVGFGAKSLITDIVAGLFIIFEGEFQVGDIVEVAGYRGMVKEIGLRTTKIISWDKNVKIINNHNITSLVNLSMRNSFATVSFRIPVTVNIDDLEKIFAEEVKELPKKYPDIIGEPFFSGVSSFNGTTMECWISAEVEELNRGDMEKALAREVQEILAKHEIPMK
ncbi:MAG: mechanosensitive ion channel [Solobacterium sp.]|nr:mechanosensitive ion channel [Solobacterium sp.]